MISIYKYFDYRNFLVDLFNWKKSECRCFSHRNLAQHLGLKAPGHILFIMQGKRRLTIDLAERLAEYLKLSKRESDYLLNLISFNHARNPNEKQYAFERLNSLRSRTAKKTDPSLYEFYSKWYYSVVRASLDVQKFSGDFKALAQGIRPQITQNEAKEAICVLERLGMVIKDNHGYYHPSEPVISTGDTWQSATIEQLQSQLINLGRQSLEETTKDKRDISSCTITLSDSSFKILKEKIKNFRSELMELANQENHPDRVIQCNIEAFPVFEAEREENK